MAKQYRTISIEKSTNEAIEKLRISENRSASAMFDILLTEALKNRKVSFPKKNWQSKYIK